MSATTRQEARQEAQEATDSFDRLINPTDIDQSADEWSDIDEQELEQEAITSVEIIRSEKQTPFDGFARDLALKLTKEALTRAPMEHLTFETKRKAVTAGYWPHSMNKWELEELIHENYEEGKLSRIYRECYQEAWDTVSAGIIDGLTDV